MKVSYCQRYLPNSDSDLRSVPERMAFLGKQLIYDKILHTLFQQQQLQEEEMGHIYIN